MKLTPQQYDQIKDVLPVQRGNVVVENIDFLNAILYVAENGCKWRALPKEFGPWHTIYTRMSRWAKKGVWPRVLEALKTKLLIEIDVTALSLDSTSVKVHPYRNIGFDASIMDNHHVGGNIVFARNAHCFCAAPSMRHYKTLKVYLETGI